MPRSPVPAPKTLRRRVTIPGLLANTTQRRWEEFLYPGFSPFALELICFDLRLRVAHEITRRFAAQRAPVQAAIDRLLVRHYRPGPEREGLLIQAAHGRWREPDAAAPPGTFARFQSHVRYSATLAPCIEIRWREAGYRTFSDYVTALLRYDLLLLGQHKYFNGADTDPEMLATLDRETVAEFLANLQPKRIYLDRLLEEAAGRELSDEERHARKTQLAEEIVARAIESGERQPKR